jgi:hypothetical protein
VFSGNLHVLIHTTADSSGGFHTDLEENGQDISGVGASGTVYSLPIAVHDSLNDPGGPTEATFTDRLGVVSHGSAPNFEFRLTSHLTFNANGELTSYHVDFATVCPG